MRRSWRSYQNNLLRSSVYKIKTKLSDFRITFKFVLIAVCSFLLLFGIFHFPLKSKNHTEKNPNDILLQKAISSLKSGEINSSNIFREFTPQGDNKSYYVKLSLDENLQRRMEKILEMYKPPYAGIVAMDPDSGKVLAMASYSRFDQNAGSNYCLKSSFSAASIFKMVTASAAVEKMKLDEDSVIGFTGGYYKLRERNVFGRDGKFINWMSLGDAFAKSANIVFAKLTTKGLIADDLRVYASQFLFNHQIPFDLFVEESKAEIPNEEYELARTAAGFGDVTLSPLHGAVLASAVLNDGTIVNPYILEKIYDKDRTLLYERGPVFSDSIVTPQTARRIKNMMETTLTKGTIRKTFSGWTRNKVLSDLSIGGKTGSLNGKILKGENDWFVGFAEEGEKRLVISAVIVNGSLWHIKPAFVAKEAFLNYFGKKNTGKYYLATTR